MKCFYHEDRDAVATCKNCGKFLCKTCAEAHTPCLCEDCFDLLRREKVQRVRTQEQQRRQKYVDALVNTRSEFFRTCVIGVVLSGLLTILVTSGGGLELTQLLTFGLLFFFIPFGWKLLTYFQSFFPVAIFGTLGFWAIWILVKGLISIFVGIPAFLYQAFRTWQNQGRIHQLQHDDGEGI